MRAIHFLALFLGMLCCLMIWAFPGPADQAILQLKMICIGIVMLVVIVYFLTCLISGLN
jgi:hypothetical protein